MVQPGPFEGGGGGGGGENDDDDVAEDEGDDLEQELIDMENEIEYAQMELDDILEMVRRDASIVQKIERRAPPEVRDFLASEDFWADVQDRYRRLDVDEVRRARGVVGRTRHI